MVSVNAAGKRQLLAKASPTWLWSNPKSLCSDSSNVSLPKSELVIASLANSGTVWYITRLPMFWSRPAIKNCSAAGILHFLAMILAVMAQAILWRQKSSILIRSSGMPLNALMTEVANTS